MGSRQRLVRNAPGCRRAVGAEQDRAEPYPGRARTWTRLGRRRGAVAVVPARGRPPARTGRRCRARRRRSATSPETRCSRALPSPFSPASPDGARCSRLLLESRITHACRNSIGVRCVGTVTKSCLADPSRRSRLMTLSESSGPIDSWIGRQYNAKRCVLKATAPHGRKAGATAACRHSRR
jgi:hypothetical protein